MNIIKKLKIIYKKQKKRLIIKIQKINEKIKMILFKI